MYTCITDQKCGLYEYILFNPNKNCSDVKMNEKYIFNSNKQHQNSINVTLRRFKNKINLFHFYLFTCIYLLVFYFPTNTNAIAILICIQT